MQTGWAGGRGRTTGPGYTRAPADDRQTATQGNLPVDLVARRPSYVTDGS